MVNTMNMMNDGVFAHHNHMEFIHHFSRRMFDLVQNESITSVRVAEWGIGQIGLICLIIWTFRVKLNKIVYYFRELKVNKNDWLATLM